MVKEMLRVTIEIVPFGIEKDKRTLSQFIIGNVYTRRTNVADYSIIEDGKEIAKVLKYKRENGYLLLVIKAITAIIVAKR